MTDAADIDKSLIRVRAYAKARGWGANRYATEAELNEATVRPMFRDNWNPTAETLRKLEAVIPAGWQPGDDVSPSDGAATAAHSHSPQDGEYPTKNGEAA